MSRYIWFWSDIIFYICLADTSIVFASFSLLEIRKTLTQLQRQWLLTSKNLRDHSVVMVLWYRTEKTETSPTLSPDLQTLQIIVYAR